MSLSDLPSVLIALLMHGLSCPERFTFARACKRTYAAADCAFPFKHAEPLRWVMRRSSPPLVGRRFLRHLPALRVDWLDNTFSVESSDVDRLCELSAAVPILELRVLATRAVSTALMCRLLSLPTLQRCLRALSLRTLPDDQTDLVSALPSLETLELLSLTIPFGGFHSLTPSLTSLTACGQRNLLPGLACCPRLLSLSVHWPSLHVDHLQRFAQLPNARQLRFLSIVHVELGRDAELEVPASHWTHLFENAAALHTFELGDCRDCSAILTALQRAHALRLLRIRKLVAWRASDLRDLLLSSPSLRVELAELRKPWPSAPAQERKEFKLMEADVEHLNADTGGRISMVFQS